MANPLLQQVRQRKMLYWGAVAVLFTLSLIHREFVVKPQAFRLQLRETARGEVELASSAVRLMMTGSRGIAVTLLWYNAMDKQKRGEWHELELLVKSITKLQPYFITPWLYQSWNISFNVAVECDKPRDKYYYISRGLELLSEGERRNRGTGDEGGAPDPNRIVFPGNPELRHHMGFTYQLKIGTSDERLTMRCLLELSCIDPVERDPDRFLTKDEFGRPLIKTDKFVDFCHDHPRLVRRLREQLGQDDPHVIVQFLKDHQKIPSRFHPARPGKPSELKDPLDQFPILPPHEGSWPNSQIRDLTSESVDVFLICRTWYEFAQKPLPPPDPNPRATIQDYDKLRFRIPKGMMTQIFRQYPARAQVYIGETLGSEGFFDSDGWDLAKAFDRLDLRAGGEGTIVGKDAKYHSRHAWDKGYEKYREFGIKNGLYLPPSEIKELNSQAALFRDTVMPDRKVKPDEMPQVQADWRTGKLGASLDAHTKLFYGASYRRMLNFDTFLYQSEAERDPVTSSARKLIFEAERMRKGRARSELMLMKYEEAWPMFLHASLKYPRFAQVRSMLDEMTEIYQRYLGETQEIHTDAFRQAALAAARMSVPPLPDWREILSHQNLTTRRLYGRHESDKGEFQQLSLRITPIKQRTGMLDSVQFYNGANAAEVREALFMVTQGLALAMNPTCASTISYPDHPSYFLTRVADDVDDVPPEWLPLLTVESRRIAASRLGLDR